MKAGDKIKIIRMYDDNGKDWQAAAMNGVVAEVSFIDSMGQIHLKGYGLALIPEADEFIVIEDVYLII